MANAITFNIENTEYALKVPDAAPYVGVYAREVFNTDEIVVSVVAADEYDDIWARIDIPIPADKDVETYATYVEGKVFAELEAI